MTDKDQVRSTEEALSLEQTLRLALEALEDLGYHLHDCPQWPTFVEPDNYPKCNCGYDQAITVIKAALANEALERKAENARELGLDYYVPCCTDKTCPKCKAALEEKDEPAAWMYPDDLKRFETSESYAEAYSIEMVSPTQGETVPLYTTPPPVAEPHKRKPLTDAEIRKWWARDNGLEDCDMCQIDDFTKVVREVEDRHGIGE